MSLKSFAIAFLTLIFWLLQTTFYSLANPADTNLVQNHSWSVCFSPRGNCTQEIVKVIGEAQKEILVQAYLFNSVPIAKSLVEAHQKGIAVEVILDKNILVDHSFMADFLARAGIPILVDGEHSSAHNKVMILDGTRVITGSFNFTKAAENKNAENLLFIDDTELAKKYIKNWGDHARHSKKFKAKSRASQSEEE